MPDSKNDRALQLRTEIVNFVECGDARGNEWLAKHPADQVRAAHVLEHRADADPHLSSPAR